MKKRSIPQTHARSEPVRHPSESSGGQVAVQTGDGGREPFPVDGMTVRPYGLPLMLPAWQGCVAWAAQERGILAAFLKETGWTPPRTHLAAMIDATTGRKAETWAKFCDWVTVHVWGEEKQEEGDAQ